MQRYFHGLSLANKYLQLIEIPTDISQEQKIKSMRFHNKNIWMHNFSNQAFTFLKQRRPSSRPSHSQPKEKQRNENLRYPESKKMKHQLLSLEKKKNKTEIQISMVDATCSTSNSI
jgi:hypothetical protein